MSVEVYLGTADADKSDLIDARTPIHFLIISTFVALVSYKRVSNKKNQCSTIDLDAKY